MANLGRREALVGSLLFVLGCSSVGNDPGGQGGAAAGTSGRTGTGGPAGRAGRGGAGGADGCTVEGTFHPNGSSFQLGCNTCTCSSAGAACTTIECAEIGGRGGTGGAGGAVGLAGWGGTGGPGVCDYLGMPYKVGVSFPAPDGCGTCVCTSLGQVACTAIACVDGGPVRCTLDANYTVSTVGGLVSYSDVALLSQSGDFTFTRTWATDAGPTSRSCSPGLPACGDPDKIDVNEIAWDLADPDVMLAFTLPAPALYGVDTRPADGSLYQIVRSSGGTIQVGSDCPVSSSSCRPIPAGIARLAADLRKLIDAQTTGIACENVNRPFPL